MASGLQNAILQAQLYMRTLPGIVNAPPYPPEQMSDFPFSVAYSGGGNWEFGPAGDKKGLHVINVELHFAREDLAKDAESAMVYSDSVPNLLMSRLRLDKWGNTISAFNNIRYTHGSMGWNGAPTYGFRWFVEGVKIVTPIT